MATREELLAEAYKRGILPPDLKELYEEATRRGLVGSAQSSTANPFDRFDTVTDNAGNPFDQFDEPKGELKVAHKSTNQEKAGVLKETARQLQPIYRPVLEGAGAVGGSLVGLGSGAVTGPGVVATTVAGGALGYATGKKLADYIDVKAGLREPYTPKELWTETAQDVGTGAAYEIMGGAAGAILVPVFRGGKLMFKKGAEAAKSLFTKEAMEKSAGKILNAHTSAGTIYARNAEEAAAIEKEIPGLRFTFGQSTGDPATIKLERTQLRKPGDAASMAKELRDANNEALRRYYETNFSGEEGIDDVLAVLKRQSDDLVQAERSTSKAVSDYADNMPTAEPEQAGRNIVDTLAESRQAAKSKASELYEQVPDMDVPVKEMLREFDDISKPMSRFEDAGNVPEILSRVTKEFADTPQATMSLNDLQGLRSELREQAREVGAGINPNQRLASRLNRAAGAVEKAIQAAEKGSEALKTATSFYREDYARVFKQGTVGDVLRRGPRGEETRIPISQIPGRIWNSKNMVGADEFIAAAGDKAKPIIKDYAAYDLLQNSTDSSGKIATSKLESWYRRNRRLLKRFGIDDAFNGLRKLQSAADAAKMAKDEFENSIASMVLKGDPEKLIANSIKGTNPGTAAKKLLAAIGDDPAARAGLQKAFADHIMESAQNLSSDLAKNPTISNAAFQRLFRKYKPAIKILYKDSPKKARALQMMGRAYELATRTTKSPIGGGSDTAENILTEIGSIAALPKTAALVRGIAKIFSKYSKQEVDRLVTRAMFDPDYAELLIRAARGKIEPGVLEVEIGRKMVKLDPYKRKMTRLTGDVLAGFGAAVDD